ncbi:MAG TPA: ABC transporter ATP-binding protein [Prevotella sp.]|nr:ABC transporter ATP-binding protein [Prevotella sp.]
MNKRLTENLSSAYFEAMNRLNSKKSRKRIVAYVESYDDVFFWRTVLSRFEDDTRYFEVMLPSHKTLERGKKSVLMNLLAGNVGGSMIACVDADYDYLINGATPTSRTIISNPYVLHTYAYAIENLQCYAPSLHNVCVMVTLNDHSIFDFQNFLQEFSQAIFPLFVWSIWHYRRSIYGEFTITDFNRIAEIGGFSLYNPQTAIDNLRRKVRNKVNFLQHRHPDAKQSWLELKKELIGMGVTPDSTYLYIQGHHLFNKIVLPIINKVCSRLVQEREDEIRRQAVHDTQRRNELSCYTNSIQDISQMLKKNMGYMESEPFRRIQEDVEKMLKPNTQQP